MKPLQMTEWFSLHLRKRKIVLLTFALVFVSKSCYVLLVNDHNVYWDGTFYFATLRSIYFDRDLNLLNESDVYPWISHSFGTLLPNGMLSNPFPIGSTILWFPFYIVADVLCHIGSKRPCDGYNQIYISSVMIGTVFWSTMGYFLNFYTINILNVAPSKRIIAFAIASVMLASPLVFYTSTQVDYAHGNQFFSVSLFLFITVYLLMKRSASAFLSIVYGFLLGLVFLVRWQDITFGVFVFPVIMCLSSKRLSFLLGTGFGLAIGMLPQIGAWLMIYSSFIIIPQGSGFLSSVHMEPIHFFFSTWNGVFFWHPILLIGFFGFSILIFTKNNTFQTQFKAFFVASVIIIVVEIIVSMSVYDWWSGGSFGQRRLISLTPFVFIGISYLFKKCATVSRSFSLIYMSIIVFLMAWNLLTLLRYYQGKLPFNPADINNYVSDQVYDHYDYIRRINDILYGNKP